MSYILEALKKSDKERRNEEIPNLRADHSQLSLRMGGRRQADWRFPGVGVFGVLLAGLSFGWWLSVERQPLQVSDVPVEDSPVVSERENFQGQSSGVLPKSVQVESEVQGEKEMTALELATMNESIVSTIVPRKEAEVPETVLLSQQALEKQPPLPPLLEDLPVSVRARIPDLSFAGHVYSRLASKRLIIINNRIVREGDLISNSFVLQEIISGGVILQYEGSTFRVKLF